MPYRIVTLVYCVVDDRVLLLKRRKPPYVGRWVAPGGKVERGEGPAEGAGRELAEETGLKATQVELRAVVTETSDRDDWQWLIFVYRAHGVDGQVVSGEADGEGELRWWHLTDEVPYLDLPPADRHFMLDAVRPESGVTEYRFTYTPELELADGRPAYAQTWSAS